MLSVRNNMPAMNANRQLGVTGKKLAKVVEKLSSGYRINRSADDAAGLAISEKMRRQIRGLTQASANAQDGISLVQSAEGAMDEMHAMLQRANELAIKAANGTLSESDRLMVDAEVQQLKTELDSMSQRTVFNETRLFPNDGADPASLSAASSSRTNNTYCYTVDYDLKTGSFKVGGASSSGARGVSGQDVLADKIANELLPNAVKQIFDAFPALKTATGSDVVKMELEIKYEDGPGNTLAYASCSFYPTGKPIKMTLTVDSADFSDADALNTGTKGEVLESTIAHELMHSVMQWNLTDGMTGRGGNQKFPDWFVEGTAQLAGGGFPTNWNNWLKNEAAGLTGANDNTHDAQITGYLQAYTVDDRPYGHGYLAAAYAGYLANGGGAVTAANIAAGMDQIFTDLLQPGSNLNTVLQNRTGCTEQQIKDLFANGDSGLVAFVRKLGFHSGAGSVIAPGGLSAGGVNILGNTAAVQAFQIEGIRRTEGTGKTWGSYGKPGSELVLQVGADAGEQVRIPLFRMDATALGLQKANTKTADAAREMIDEVAAAIGYVSSVRTLYGALQNRLEHTIRNLDNVVENTTAAESVIRDQDMADAMVEYSNLQILQQAGQAILSQANHAGEVLLTLLNA